VARAGENHAARLLTAAGFEILEHQPSCVWELAVDGVTTTVESRADFLVRRAGRLFVADAKSGGRAPDPRLPATRRQLLEYLLVFEVDAVLLVDTERGVILTLDFPMLERGGDEGTR
jgi:predicted type IV restriction endonuclease